MIIAGYFGVNPPGFVAQTVAFAFGLAAASFFPAILLGIFSRRMNKEGAISGMIAGIVFTAAYIIYFAFMFPELNNEKNWLFGIIGATIVGFHALMIMVSENAFKRRERWSYWALWLGLLSWFIIDSGISVYYGAIYNLVLINLFALFLIGLPLLMTRTEFVDR